MNRNLWLLAICQGLFLTNNVTFIAINGLVGLSLAPLGWMATLPVMGYVVGGALSTTLVAHTQRRFGRKTSFQLGLLVAVLSALLCGYAAYSRNFWLLVTATVIAGYYNANAQLYRFAAAELALPSGREKAVSLVMAGGLIGAVAGPNLAVSTRSLTDVPFAGGRPLGVIMRQPVFIVAASRRRARLRRHEPVDGRHADCHANLQPAVLKRGNGAGVACDRHVCARFFYRAFDQAFWHAAHHGRWSGTQCAVHRDCAVGH